MNTERLERLATFLDALVPNETHRFDMGLWFEQDEDAGHLEGLIRDGKVKLDRNGDLIQIDCGYAGCACGWAPYVPGFQEEGYVLHFDEAAGYITPCLRRADGTLITGEIESAQEFFDLDDTAAAALFLPDAYMEEGYEPTPQQVAARIHSVIANA